MKNNIELLLVNSYAPRQRSISDAAIDNSISIIRTALEDKNINTLVVDDQRLSLLENGVPQWGKMLLRKLTKLQLKYYKNKAIGGALFLLGWPLHAFTLLKRRQYMQDRLDSVVQEIQENNIPFLGIKLWYGDAYTWSLKLAAAVRRQCPETVIIAGGPQTKVYGDIILDDGEFDLVIMGPGESVLANIVAIRRKYATKDDFLREVEKAYGSCFITAGGFSGDKNQVVRELAVQTVPLYRDEDLDDKILFHTIVDGVGCSWNACNFCSHTRCQVNFTSRPVEDIIEEIETMVRRGVSFFRFSSSETPLQHGRTIAEAIVQQGINIRFSMFARAIRPDKEALEAYRLMIRAGLRAVFMGGETGHDLVNRQIMNKGVEKKNIVDTIATIRLASDAAGLPCRIGLALIYPCPVPEGVSLEDVYKSNVALIDETLPDTVIVNPPGPMPGTRWFDEAEKFGFSFNAGADNFKHNIMRYEYSMFKPPELWQDIGFSLQGMDIKQLLKETGRLRAYAASIGIPTDISDEYLMMTEAIGLRSKLDMLGFKQQTLLDIVSGSTEYTRRIAAAINAASRELAEANIKAISLEKAKARQKIAPCVDEPAVDEQKVAININ